MSFHLLLPTLKRRPLNPSRKERKKVTSIGNNVEVKLIVTVMHGLNVPIRTEIGNKLTKLDAENVGKSLAKYYFSHLFFHLFCLYNILTNCF